MPYCSHIGVLTVQSIVPNRIDLAESDLAALRNSGNKCMQGGHHGAKKSTKKACLPCAVNSSDMNVASSLVSVLT